MKKLVKESLSSQDIRDYEKAYQENCVKSVEEILQYCEQEVPNDTINHIMHIIKKHGCSGGAWWREQKMGAWEK